MRPVMHGDLVAAARSLRALPEAERAAACRMMIAQARWADAYRRALGRPHPEWGDGSLMAVAARHPGPREPFLSDSEYLHCLWVVISALLGRARGHRGRKDPQGDFSA